MPTAYLHVQLSVEPLKAGAARLVVPKALRDISYRFVVIKDGGAEGIVRVDAPDAVLKKIAHGTVCKKLTPKQLKELQASYPAPKVKRQYRRATNAGNFETDARGNRVVETVQTVRSGFYLIDVPIESASAA